MINVEEYMKQSISKRFERHEDKLHDIEVSLSEIRKQLRDLYMLYICL